MGFTTTGVLLAVAVAIDLFCIVAVSMVLTKSVDDLAIVNRAGVKNGRLIVARGWVTRSLLKLAAVILLGVAGTIAFFTLATPDPAHLLIAVLFSVSQLLIAGVCLLDLHERTMLLRYSHEQLEREVEG